MMIQLYYQVTDCEHEGDIRDAIRELEKVGYFELENEFIETDDDGEIIECNLQIRVPYDLEEIFIEFGCYR